MRRHSKSNANYINVTLMNMNAFIKRRGKRDSEKGKHREKGTKLEIIDEIMWSSFISV